MTNPVFPLPGVPKKKSRGWLTFFGIFSILIGFLAISFPYLFSIAITQVIGIVLVVSGVFSVGAVVFGEERNHRVATVFLALIRLAAGLAMLVFVLPSVQAVTLVLAAFFFAEGVTFLISAFSLRHNRAWLLILLNGVVSIVLGGMIFSGFPGTADWAIGLLYGINSIFYGVSLLGFAAGAKSAEPR